MWTAAAWLLLLVAPSSNAATRCDDEGCVWVRPQDTVYLISSRPVGCSTSPAALEQGLHAETYADADGDGRRDWQGVPWRTVLACDTTQPLVVYSHGNRISWGETRRRGLYVYKRLMRCAGDERPINYLIWSWCADELDKPLVDYRVKAARTAPVGKQLAWVLNQLPGDTRLGLMGYSYGARVTSGALHELGSGNLQGPTRWVRAVYLAAAYDAHWLSRGQRHGCAMNVTESLLLSTNRLDPAMRFYHLLPRGYDPQAMGYAGPTCLDRERASRVRLFNCTKYVGRSHDLCDYVRTPGLMPRACRMLTYADQSEVEVASAATGSSNAVN